MADDFVLPSESPPAPQEDFALPSEAPGGFSLPSEKAAPAAPAKPELSRLEHVGAMVTDIWPKTQEAFTSAVSKVNRNLNPFSEGYAKDMDEYLKETATASPFDFKPQLKSLGRVGSGLMGLIEAPASVITGPGRAILGHGFDAIKPHVSPERRAQLEKEGVHLPEGDEVADTALAAIAPGRGGIRTGRAPTPAPPTPPPPKTPMDVVFSQGQETGKLPLIQKEQEALRGTLGPKAQQHAAEFEQTQQAGLQGAKEHVLSEVDRSGRNAAPVETPHEAAELLSNALVQDQQGRTAALRTGETQLQAAHEGLRSTLSPNGQVLATTPQEAANIISGSVAQASESAQAATNAAYTRFRELPGQFHPASFNKVAAEIRARVASPEDPTQITLINPQRTPNSMAALDELQEILGGVAQRRNPETGQIIPRPPVTPALVENARTRLNTYLGDAISAARATYNWADVRAMENIIEEFDSAVSRKLRTTFSGGDPAEVIRALDEARGLYRDYRRTYTSRGSGDVVGPMIQNIIGRHEGQALTPETLGNILYGTGRAAVPLGRRLIEIFGPNSEQVGALRQGLFSHITERPPGAAAWGPEKVADRIDQYTRGAGRSVTETYLGPQDVAALRQHAQNLRRQAATTNAELDPVDRIIAGITGGEGGTQASTQYAVRKLFDDVLANNKDAVELARRLRDRFGENSPQWGQYRQGLLKRAMEKGNGLKDYNNQKIADNLKELSNSQSAREVYPTDQLQLIRELGNLYQKVIVPQKGANWSNTAAATKPLLDKIVNTVSFAVGGLLAHQIAPMGGLTELAAGWTAAKGSAAFSNARHAKAIAKQMPLVSDDLVKYQKALAAYNKTQNGLTRKALTTGVASLTKSLGGLGVDLTKIPGLQMPGMAPADEKKDRADGGAVVQDPFEGSEPVGGWGSAQPDFSWVDQGNQTPNELAAARVQRAAEPSVPRDMTKALGIKRSEVRRPPTVAATEAMPFEGTVEGYGTVEAPRPEQIWPDFNDQLSEHERAAERTRSAVKPMAGRKEGVITKGLEHLGEEIYNMGARPARVWGALNTLKDGETSLSDRPDIVDAGVQTGLDIVGLPGLAAPAMSGAALASGVRKPLVNQGWLAPAIKYEGKVYTSSPGTSHVDTIEVMREKGAFKEKHFSPGEWDAVDQGSGFVTPDGRFLDRAQAFKYAEKNRQIDKNAVTDKYRDEELGAEDLASPKRKGAILRSGTGDDGPNATTAAAVGDKLRVVEGGKAGEQLPYRATAKDLDDASEAFFGKKYFELPVHQKREAENLAHQAGYVTDRPGHPDVELLKQHPQRPGESIWDYSVRLGNERTRSAIGGEGTAPALSKAEQEAVKAWSDDFDRVGEINYDLRRGLSPNAIDDPELITSLSSAIQKSPVGKDTRLYRGISATDDDLGRKWGEDFVKKLERLKPGETIKDPGFVATSTGRGAASDYGPPGTGMPGAVMVIDVKAGDKAIPVPSGQGEVLLDRGSTFRFEGRDANGDYLMTKLPAEGPTKQGVVSLGQHRERKQLEGFHKELTGSVTERAQKMAQMGREYHEAGKLPMEVGTKFMTNHSRERGLLPWEVKGHYVDPKNPERYGYRVERGVPDKEGYESTLVLANDPKNPRIEELAKGFVPMGGPRKLYSGSQEGPNATTGAALYSVVERAVQNASQNKASPEQWVGWLKNQPGVKAEELAHLGLDDWAKSQKGPVSKEELLNHVKSHNVQLKGIEYKTLNDRERADLNERGQIISRGLYDADKEGLLRSDPKVQKLLAEQEEVLGQLHRNARYGPGGDHGDRLVLPGGENYREILLTSPNRTLGDKKALDAQAQKDYGYKSYDDLPPAYQASIQKDLGAQTDYRSRHWGDEPNVLLHTRVNDREIPGVGKSLHLEELQSDWHQQGRKQGYHSSEVELGKKIADSNVKRAELEKDVERLQKEYVAEGGPERLSALQKQIDLVRAESQRGNEFYALKGKSIGVPNAPYKTSWPELGLRNAITKAVKEGYDSISWTPGIKQAERYDLSKQIDYIDYREVPGGYQLGIVDKHGTGVDLPKDTYTKDQLADVVGKEVAEKIVTGEGQKGGGRTTLRNVDLKIGGEGMKAFYDKMLVDKANAIGKKYGAKVELKDLRAKGEEAGWRPFNETDWETFAGAEEGSKIRYRGNNAEILSPDGKMVHQYNEDGLQGAFRYNPKDDLKDEILKVPVLRFTPEFKEHVLQNGLPLFANNAGKTGAAAAAVSELRGSGKLTVKDLEPNSKGAKDAFGEDLPPFSYHPEYVYHGTTSDRLDSIKKEGLRKGSYLATDPSIAREEAQYTVKGDPYAVDPKTGRYSDDHGEGGKPVVLAIRKDALGKHTFKEDDGYITDSDWGRSLIVDQGVPATAIGEVLEKEAAFRKHYKQLKNADWSKHYRAAGGAVSAAQDQQQVPGPPAQEHDADQEGAQQRAAGGRVLASNIDKNPTEAQKEAGNYAKDHVNVAGFAITIENAKGSKRSGVGADGKPWTCVLPADYGYFKKSAGADGDHLDVYLGPHRNSKHVFLIDQIDARTGEFDEHKVLMFFGSEKQATDVYKRAFSDGKGIDRIGAVSALSLPLLKLWLEHADTTKPFSPSVKG